MEISYGSQLESHAGRRLAARLVPIGMAAVKNDFAIAALFREVYTHGGNNCPVEPQTAGTGRTFIP